MAEKEFSGTKIELCLNMLKQPSTIKGILGMIGILGARFGLRDALSPEDFATVVEGMLTVYFLVAIFWQKN